MTFNADAFLSATVNAANDTVALPVPVGDYFAIITEVKPRQWQSKDGTKTGVAVDLTWLIEDENVKQYLGRDTVTVRQGIMLDLNAQGGLDTSSGKNISLGRLREALNKNNPGDQFSFAMLPGLSARVSVAHRVSGEQTYAEVKAVARL